MAIINNNVKQKIVDRDENIFIGLDLPFRKSNGAEGWFKSTTTTFNSVRNNIKSLLLTQKGERIMQPSLGLNLRKYLFQPLTAELNSEIENEIYATFGFRLPFVKIERLDIGVGEETDIGRNTINISLQFSIMNNNNFYDTIQVSLGE